jgi:antitoxin (DNA-binding transcriptional repressor) of toxin-antitoxin stability system
MTQTISINNLSIQTVVRLAKSGDEIVLEENGKPFAKITPIEETKEIQANQRIAGLGKGNKYFMSDDFDAELPDEFWGFDKEL